MMWKDPEEESRVNKISSGWWNSPRLPGRAFPFRAALRRALAQAGLEAPATVDPKEPSADVDPAAAIDVARRIIDHLYDTLLGKGTMINRKVMLRRPAILAMIRDLVEEFPGLSQEKALKFLATAWPSSKAAGIGEFALPAKAEPKEPEAPYAAQPEAEGGYAEWNIPGRKRPTAKDEEREQDEEAARQLFVLAMPKSFYPGMKVRPELRSFTPGSDHLADLERAYEDEESISAKKNEIERSIAALEAEAAKPSRRGDPDWQERLKGARGLLSRWQESEAVYQRLKAKGVLQDLANVDQRKPAAEQQRDWEASEEGYLEKLKDFPHEPSKRPERQPGTTWLATAPWGPEGTPWTPKAK